MKQIIIYARYSSALQRDESLDAQEAKCRQKLKQAGIDDSDALVLTDRAQRGDREDRPEYQRLSEMIRAGKVSVLCVDRVSLRRWIDGRP